jgi:hypothetical protein
MSNISLKSLLEGPFKPLVFRNSGQVWFGQEAWVKWKRWADINKRNDYIYKVLNTIQNQKYQASKRQQKVLDKWFGS